jgi:hypothetical protein
VSLVSKPVAVAKEMVCSECGLDWDLHPENPRRRDCIELLKPYVNYAPVPITWNIHYCNWGHANCWTHHGDSTGTYFISSDSVTGSAVTYTGLSVIQDDDPDNGVAAQVS